MDYTAALKWWLQRVDFEKRPAGRDELKLDRMRALLYRIGNPQDRLRIVHIAGTKGKGSTAAMIAACAQAAGLNVGLFTSPHLNDVRERIQINGSWISETELATRLSELFGVVTDLEKEGNPPTFFEIATALAFNHFAMVQADLAVIEVGLGGRFDATNVCRPAVSVITSISHDHTAILGETLEQIAFEKCGIIKPGVPVVSGVITAEPADVIRRIAIERQSPLLERDRDFHFTHKPGHVAPDGSISQSKIIYHDGLESSFSIGLLGAHQAANASVAIATIEVLNREKQLIPVAAVRQGLAEVQWPARMEVFPGNPMIVLDCAHNIASAKALVNTLAESFRPSRRALIFAISADKDIPGILATLLPFFDVNILTQFHLNPRAVPPNRLKEMAIDSNLKLTDNPLDALNLARRAGVDLIVVTGSVFLAGELRPHLVEDR